MAVLTDQAAQDNFIRDVNADTNYSTVAVIQVGEDNTGANVTRSIVKFDLSSIPTGSTIDSAVLTLTYQSEYSSNARTFHVYRIKQAVNVAQSTWNSYATGQTWATAGCGNTTSDREATDIGSFTQPANPTLNTTVDITLTAAKIQEMITGGVFTNNGFLLKIDTETDDLVEYHSAEATTESYRPKLVVNYTPPGGGMMMFF